MPSQSKQKKEYLGCLVRSDTKELVPEYPIIWVQADQNGGWKRLKIKFDLNNLIFDGSLVPGSVSATKDSVRDLVSTCRNHGIEVAKPPTKAISYTTLVKTLESLGLVAGDPEHDVHDVPGNGPSDLDDAALHKEHRDSVSDYVANQARYEVTTPVTRDALAEALQTEIDIHNPDFIIDHTEIVGPAPPTENEDLPSDEHVHDPAPPTDVGGDDVAIMKSELASAHNTIANLNGELARLRAKCLALENQASSDRGQLAAQLGSSVGQAISAGFQTLELSFANKVAVEMRAELHRQTNEIMEEVSVLKGMKSVTDMSHNTLTNIDGAMSEVAKAIGSSKAQMLSLHKKIDSNLSSPNNPDVLSQIRTTLSANTTLLNEVLKNKSFPVTGPASSASGPLTPNQTPQKQIRCLECGSFDHSMAQCPERLNFCARCLSNRHRVYQCPHMKDICTICKDASRGDLAHGHLSKVHQETDREKREHITRYISSICFPDWFPSFGIKRQYGL